MVQGGTYIFDTRNKFEMTLGAKTPQIGTAVPEK